MSLALQQHTTNKIIAFEFSEDKAKLLKDMFFKDSTDSEFQIFLHACQRTGLDPFMKQIHPVKRAGRMTIQTGIDGFRLIAERTGRYAPGKETTFSYDEQGKLVSATAYIRKQTIDGTWHEVSATAFWKEYVQVFNGKPGQFWEKMPHTMLSKVAESIALRKAFPADFSGIYTHEEMSQADNQESPNTISINPVELKKTEMKEEVEEEKEVTFDELNEYLLKNWGEQHDEFRRFMNDLIEHKKWNYRKAINMFEKHKEHTKQTFSEWLEKKERG